jgi:hypothetical protein
MLEPFGLNANSPALDAILGGTLGDNPFAGDLGALRQVLSLLAERNELLQQQGMAEEQLIAHQNELMRLEAARANFEFLKQQFDLIKLINENGLSPDLLQGIEFGTNADPAALMQAMVGAMEALVGQSIQGLQAIVPPPPPETRSALASEFFRGVGTTTTTGAGVTVNIDARGAETGTEERIRRVVEEVMRDYGAKADIRMRTG